MNTDFEHLTLDNEVEEAVLLSAGLEDTEKIGNAIGKSVTKEDVILLSGNLGAGKTELVRSIVLGTGNNNFVRSPTFVFINEYRGKINITHCDFYRIEDVVNLQETGIEEYYDNSLVLMEWPERINNNLPKDNLIIKIFFNEIENDRIFKFFTSGDKSKQLFERIIINYETNNS